MPLFFQEPDIFLLVLVESLSHLSSLDISGTVTLLL
jgi:hypothetical protein